MIRTRTTVVIGAEGGCELQLPSSAEMMARVAQGFEFRRMGTERETRDTTILAEYLGNVAKRLQKPEEEVRAAAERFRLATHIGRSVDALIDQNDNDPLVAMCGKLAIAHVTCQSEARSILRAEPRTPGELPIQGSDTWLFQLAQLITSGVTSRQIEHCMDELTVITFGYDRSFEHFLPWALSMAFGMDLVEARHIVAAKLRIIHPFGAAGRLPWQSGKGPECDWGVEQPRNILAIAAQLRTSSEALRDSHVRKTIRYAVGEARRLVFLGFAFQPQHVDLLIDHSLMRDPEILAMVCDQPPAIQAAILRVLKRKTGIIRDELIVPVDAKAGDLLRDYGLLLES